MLVFLQIANEIRFISRPFQFMTPRLDEELVIPCDNTQTIRLVDTDSAKLNTKLRHADVRRH